jgi:hypothetical protein
MVFDWDMSDTRLQHGSALRGGVQTKGMGDGYVFKSFRNVLVLIRRDGLA